jgi:hypothetical protein
VLSVAHPPHGFSGLPQQEMTMAKKKKKKKKKSKRRR